MNANTNECSVAVIASSKPVLDGGSVNAQMVARFGEGESNLSVDQEQQLAYWISSKLKSGFNFKLVLGGASKTSRSGRLRRLYALIHALQRMGVAAKRIWPDIEWTKPARMGALEDMPADTVWLRLAYRHADN